MLKFALLTLSVLIAGVAGAADVVVFTDSAHPVTNTGDARVVYLDRAEKIEREMSAGLPNDIDRAEKIVKDRLNTPDGQRMIEELTESSKDLMLAWELGVKKIPAVVVDSQFVVYGQTDVGLAVSRITTRRAGQETPGVTLPTVPSGRMPTQELLKKPLRVDSP